MEKTTNKQKILLIILGIFLFLILLEIGLRLGGFVISLKRFKNEVYEGDKYVILCLGESTTANSGYSWPELLESTLNEKSLRTKFEVINEGREGTNTALILLRLEKDLEEYKPDMVVTMMGINDLWTKVHYTDTLKTRLILFFENIRTYKLGRLLWIHIEDKIKDMRKKETQIEINDKQMEIACKEILEKEPENYMCYFNLAEIYKRQGNYDEAEKLYKKAIELNPAHFNIYFGFADLYFLEGRYDEAEGYYKKSIELNQSFDKSYQSLGSLYISESRFDEAEDMFYKAIKINESDYNSYFGLGVIYKSTNRYKKAEEFLKKAIDLNPYFCFPYNNLADLYVSQGRYDEAETYLKQIIELDPNCNRIYITLGSLYERIGNYEKAEEIYKKSISFDEVSDYAHFRLIEVQESKAHEAGKDLNLENLSSVTEYHYQMLYKILSERRIKVIVMQYPLRDIDEFKSFFGKEQQENIIFVSNEENFKKALENASYDDYFTDRFAGDFGHCNIKGNRLIAENVADAILGELEIE